MLVHQRVSNLSNLQNPAIFSSDFFCWRMILHQPALERLPSPSFWKSRLKVGCTSQRCLHRGSSTQYSIHTDWWTYTSDLFQPIWKQLMKKLRKQWHELGMICANHCYTSFSVVVSVSNNPSHQCLGSTGEWMPWVDASDPYQVIKVGWWNADWWIFGKFCWPWCLVVAQWHHV